MARGKTVSVRGHERDTGGGRRAVIPTFVRLARSSGSFLSQAVFIVRTMEKLAAE